MASRETSIQMAGVLDGEAGCALSPEPLLVGVPSRAAGEYGVLPSDSKLEVHITAEPRLMKQTQHHSWRSLVGGGEAPALLRSDSTRELDRRFDHFKTFSGRLDRQLSSLRGLQHGLPPVDIEHGAAPNISIEDTDEENIVPSADRYFAALEGPELETLRVGIPHSDQNFHLLITSIIAASL